MKQKKSKPNNNNNKKPRTTVKKHGKQADLAQLCSQLDALGLKIIQVTADGNCLFRAVADQLEGNEEEHRKYRSMVVQYILNHREDFEPFIEDDVPFDEYYKSMEKDGTWAGNLELQAASLVTRTNICIHQANSPRLYIRNFSDQETTMIHLSYHDGEHYNSVRLVNDACDGPARPIIIKVDTNLSAMDHNKRVTNNESKVCSRKDLFDSGSVKMVMAGTSCGDNNKVERVLREVGGDVDAAIEFLIAEQQADLILDKSDGLSCEIVDCPGDDENRNLERLKVTSGDTAADRNESKSDSYDPIQCHEDDKTGAANKECLCGSKKCKACCGSTAGKSVKAPVIKNNSTARKGKKAIKRAKKKEDTREAQNCRSESLPDVGALCI